MEGFKNITYDDTDPALVYGPGGSWFHGSWNASHTGHSGTLSTSNNLVDNVTFIFPQPAIAFYYYGIKRARGGVYRICVDCDNNNPVYDEIDAVNTTDDGGNDPVLLYSKQFSGLPGIHRVFLQNQPDQRFPNNNSQIDIDRFEIEVPDPNSTGSTIPTVVTTVTSVVSFGSSTPSASSLDTSPRSQTSINVGAILGGVIGGLAALLGTLAVWYWCWRKRQREKFVSQDDSESPLPPPTPFTLPETMSQVPISPSSGQFLNSVKRGYLQNARESRGRDRGQSFGSSHWSMPTTSSAALRREVDAGPLSGQTVSGEAHVLPPDYEQVFQGQGSQEIAGQPSYTVVKA